MSAAYTRALPSGAIATARRLPSTPATGIESRVTDATGTSKPELQTASPVTAEPESDRFGNVRTAEHIHMNGFGVLAFANEYMPGAVRDFLEANDTSVDDLDLVIFHQASRVALDSLCRLTGVGPERNFENLAGVGNLVSASIPVALAEAASRGRLQPGSLVLLCSFGVGLSWGNALIRVPAALTVKYREAGS